VLVQAAFSCSCALSNAPREQHRSGRVLGHLQTTHSSCPAMPSNCTRSCGWGCTFYTNFTGQRLKNVSVPTSQCRNGTGSQCLVYGARDIPPTRTRSRLENYQPSSARDSQLRNAIAPTSVSNQVENHSESFCGLVETTLSSEYLDVQGVCKDGFCDFSSIDEPAVARSEREPSRTGQGQSLSALAGLAVVDLNVKDLQSNGVSRSVTKVFPSEGTSGLRPQEPATGVNLHPDAERRRRARAARKAGRRKASQVISEKEWWKAETPSNMVEVYSEDAFAEAIQATSAAGQIAIVDYYAPWCQSCRRQFPDLINLAKSHSNVVFFKVNAANMRSMCEGVGVQRLPSYSLHTPAGGTFLTGFLPKLTEHLDAQLSPVETHPAE